VKGDIDAHLSSLMCHCSHQDSTLYVEFYSFQACEYRSHI